MDNCFSELMLKYDVISVYLGLPSFEIAGPISRLTGSKGDLHYYSSNCIKCATAANDGES